MRRNYCAADVRGGVQLVRQRSDSPCIFNRTWGFINGRGIWVDRGCRADFQITRPNWGGWDNGYNIYCASDNGGKNYCPTDTRGGVQLIRQRSGSACDSAAHGDTIAAASGSIAAAAPTSRSAEVVNGGGGGWTPAPGPGTQIITCSSNDGRRNVLPDHTHGGVRLVRQRSDSDCTSTRLGATITAAFGSIAVAAPTSKSAAFRTDAQPDTTDNADHDSDDLVTAELCSLPSGSAETALGGSHQRNRAVNSGDRERTCCALQRKT